MQQISDCSIIASPPVFANNKRMQGSNLFDMLFLCLLPFVNYFLFWGEPTPIMHFSSTDGGNKTFIASSPLKQQHPGFCPLFQWQPQRETSFFSWANWNNLDHFVKINESKAFREAAGRHSVATTHWDINWNRDGPSPTRAITPKMAPTVSYVETCCFYLLV